MCRPSPPFSSPSCVAFLYHFIFPLCGQASSVLNSYGDRGFHQYFVIEMKWVSGLPDRIHHRRTRRRSSALPEAMPPAPAQPLDETHPASPHIHSVTQTDNTYLRPCSAVGQSGSVWSAACGEALSQLDEEMRLVVSKDQNLEKLFNNLNETNDKQKNESVFRRGIGKLQTPIKFVDSGVKLSSPVAGFDPRPQRHSA